MNSCTSPRRHGRITHQPEDAGSGPDLSCYPPLSHGSSRFKVGDRRTRGFRAPCKWECLTVTSTNTAGFSSPTTSVGPPTRRVAAVGVRPFQYSAFQTTHASFLCCSGLRLHSLGRLRGFIPLVPALVRDLMTGKSPSLPHHLSPHCLHVAHFAR